ncbi:hypothetical protein Tco_0590755 [Tanacetum coccineum]
MAIQKNAILWDTLTSIKGGKVSTYDDVEDLDDQQFIVHGPNINAVQNKHSEERTNRKEVPLSLRNKLLHDDLEFDASKSIGF